MESRKPTIFKNYLHVFNEEVSKISAALLNVRGEESRQGVVLAALNLYAYMRGFISEKGAETGDKLYTDIKGCLDWEKVSFLIGVIAQDPDIIARQEAAAGFPLYDEWTDSPRDEDIPIEES